MHLWSMVSAAAQTHKHLPAKLPYGPGCSACHALIPGAVQGVEHLRQLQESGLTHVHLLPSYDFGSVPERADMQLRIQVLAWPQAACTGCASCSRRLRAVCLSLFAGHTYGLQCKHSCACKVSTSASSFQVHGQHY